MVDGAGTAVLSIKDAPGGSGEYLFRVRDVQEGVACTHGYTLIPGRPVQNVCAGGALADGRAGHTAGWNFTAAYKVNLAEILPIAGPGGGGCAAPAVPVAQQFAIDLLSVKFHDRGLGDDWALFRCLKTAGKTLYQANGGKDFSLATAAQIANNMAIRKYGFGADGDPNSPPDLASDDHCKCHAGDVDAPKHFTQQTSQGTITGIAGSRVDHNVHDCGGDSGEPLVDNANVTRVVAIGTIGSCNALVPANIGTKITDGALQDELATDHEHVASGACCNQFEICNDNVPEPACNGPWDSFYEEQACTAIEPCPVIFASGSCCSADGTFCDEVSALNCDGTWTPGQSCDANSCNPIPTVSEWGLMVMTLLILIAGTIAVGWRRQSTEV